MAALMDEWLVGRMTGLKEDSFVEWLDRRLAGKMAD